MTLTNLRRFYETVTPERLEEYLREHDWTPRASAAPNALYWTSPRNSANLLGHEIPLGLDGLQTVEAFGCQRWMIETIAMDEERQPSSVLFDLLPDDAMRRALLDELLPDAGRILNLPPIEAAQPEGGR